ncbi:hypothetical protein GCM10027285_10380 [Oleiagrimonas citrea]|uniref:Carboxypeptidase regulatory-like domain-containing protein n=1 Tax=Oleiagrimonas citrea TaxID=1665687 RepID=A0A846ZLI4_9GAMM|nr:carboxypeptidase-like regulatory domain-containing protein [Oleiagrimonas citrea]NKZ38400.1 carboxypeptidase regulatory-like domain-containing protein [Oleiagrimonas citrea]
MGIYMEGRKQKNGLHGGRVRGMSAVLAVAVVTCAGALLPATAVRAQSTAGMIHGQAPAGDVVLAHSTSGVRRTTVVKKNGQFELRHLPLGVYSVTLKKGDKVIDMYHRVPLTVGRGLEVNFACPHDQCAAP